MKEQEVGTADLSKRIAIAGGGYAGATLAQRLER
jgi:hypothetical protein